METHESWEKYAVVGQVSGEPKFKGYMIPSEEILKELLHRRDEELYQQGRVDGVEEGRNQRDEELCEMVKELRHSIIKADKTPRYSYDSKSKQARNNDGELPDGGRWKNCYELVDDLIYRLQQRNDTK